jgi:branched-chain amino acid transport system substrate-binding protein
MKIKWYAVFVIVLLMVLGLAPEGRSGEPIHIALSAPMTGNYAEYGQNFQRAIGIAVEWINAAGGIKSRPITIVAGDSKGDPKEAAALAQKFTSDNQIVAEIGDFTSTACMAAQPIYDQAGMVQLSPTSSHPDFAPKSPWSFGIVGTQAGEGPFMAKYAIERLGKKRIVILYINNDWGIATKDYFEKAAKEMGAEIVGVESFLERDRDFAAVLTKLRGMKPDALFIPSMYNEGALISKQREKMGWNDVAVLGPGSLFSPKLLEIGGSAVEGLHTSTIFFDKDPQPNVQKFVRTFETKYNVMPNMFAAVAFDSLNILAEAIRKAGTDRKAIREELAKTKNFPGLTGNITFTERRDVIKDYRYLVVKNGQWALFDK